MNLDSWQNLALEIPNFNWEDVSRVQIAIQSLSPVDFAPTVYLDSLWLEVEYESLPAPVAGSLSSPESISESMLETLPQTLTIQTETQTAPQPVSKPVIKIFDQQAEHKCVINPFSQEISEGTSVNYNISLKPSSSNRPYEIILGDLPSGVGADFEQPFSGSTAPTTIPLSLTAEANAQNGSFNIAVIYRETQTNGEILSNFCQLNLVIE